MTTTPMMAIRALAMKLPDVTEGIACPGTAMERRTVKVATKAFVFLGVGDALLKLDGELPEAKRMAKAEPERFRAGANGWVKITFDADRPPPLAVLKRWLVESHRLAVMAKPKPKTKAKPKR